jgi:predicted Rossmann-fold nucleotide-binding protein
LQDELFEILTLVQLKKLGSSHPVPVVLIDYDGFYSGLLQVWAEVGCRVSQASGECSR